MCFRMSCVVVLAGLAGASSFGCSGDDGGEDPSGSIVMVELDGPEFVGAEVVTRVVARDPAGVLRVDLFLDQMRVGEAEFAPFVVTWDASGFDEGPHELRALAYASDGGLGEATQEVLVDHTAPTVEVPTTASRGQAFVVAAYDNASGIASVAVERDGRSLAEFREPPFQFDWPGGCGQVPVRAVAIDQAGNEGVAEVSLVADDFQDVDCDGQIASMFGGPDCDDASAEVGPRAEDLATSLVDFNCDGMPGVDADADGVPSQSSGGTDCADDDPGQRGTWPGWLGVPLRFTGTDTSLASVAMSEAGGRIGIAFEGYDAGLYYGETTADGEDEIVVAVESVESDVDVIWGRGPAVLRLANGDVAVAFSRSGALAVAVRRGSGSWVITDVDSGVTPGRASITGTSVDALHLVYEWNVFGLALQYATNAGGTWQSEALPDAQFSAEAPQIAVDAQGRPRVLYESRTEFRLATRLEGGWTSTVLWPDRNQVYRYTFAPRGSTDPILLAATVSESEQERIYWGAEGNGFFLSSGITLAGPATALSVRSRDEFLVAVSLPESSQALGFYGGAAQQIGSALVAQSASTTSLHALVDGPLGGYWLASSHPTDGVGCFGAGLAPAR